MFLNFKKLLFLFVLNLVVMYGSDESKPSIISMITASILCPWVYSNDTNITYRLCANPSKDEIDYAKEQFCSMVQKKINLGSDEANIKYFFEIGKVRSYFNLSELLYILLGVAKRGESGFDECWSCLESEKAIISQYQLNLMDSKLTFFGPLKETERELWIIVNFCNRGEFLTGELFENLKNFFNFIFESSDSEKLKKEFALEDEKVSNFLKNLFNNSIEHAGIKKEDFQILESFIAKIYSFNKENENLDFFGILKKKKIECITFLITDIDIYQGYFLVYGLKFKGWSEFAKEREKRIKEAQEAKKEYERKRKEAEEKYERQRKEAEEERKKRIKEKEKEIKELEKERKELEKKMIRVKLEIIKEREKIEERETDNINIFIACGTFFLVLSIVYFMYL